MLRVVYLLGWLPALIAAAIAYPLAGPSHVLAGGRAGAIAGLGLGLSLTLLGAAYVVALRRPPARRTLLVACFGSLVVASALPVLFSADVYAYAYYGDLARHGHNPYGHRTPPHPDALTAAAIQAWDGRIPPRCVYGPVAVAIAAVADLAGTPGGVAAEITGQRLAAVVGYAGFVWCVLRLLPDARTRAALLLNPVLLWSTAEGHNDALMIALIFAGLALPSRHVSFFGLASLTKAPALLMLTQLRRPAPLLVAGLAGAVAAGYAPLVIAFAWATRDASQLPLATAWQSPLGLLAALTGRAPALAIAAATLCALAVAVRRFEPLERTAVLALGVWFALPNAYPWYAFWIVPLAARRLDSLWSQALLTASLAAPARGILDAIFEPPSTIAAAATFHGWMIALEFLPPLAFLVLAAGWRRRRVVGAVAIAMLLAICRVPAEARQTTSGPAPAAPPIPNATSGATPALPPQPAGPVPAPTTQAAPNVTPMPTPSPEPLPSPAAGPTPTAVAVPTPIPAPTPVLAPLSNPFTYVITPTPVPVTTPDGPHIIEVMLNDHRIRAGGPLIVRVVTTPNVVGVEARALGRFIPIPQNSPGLFSLAYTMPGGIPFWLLNRNYDIVIAAATADGRQVTVSFPMLLTR